MVTILAGQVLSFRENPFLFAPKDAVHIDEALAIEGQNIIALGQKHSLQKTYPQARLIDYGHSVISAGFIDAHVHYPQTAIIAAWGKRLIDWLNDYTFPEEMRFEDPAYAAAIAQRYFALTRAHGTTSLASFCTTHPASVDAFFTAAAQHNQRVWGGKTCMDRNAPDRLRDSAQSAYDDSARLLAHWHGRGRAAYVITPRFSPTSSPEQLSALGALWRENPTCLMQTHLSEQQEEITWLRHLFPKARDYLDSYERYGLLGPGGIYGHAIWLEPREKARLAEVGASVIHCPTSNSFIGSGLFDMAWAAQTPGLRVGLASDTGGGSSFSMLRTMAAAYEIAQLRGHALHPAQLWWLATKGSATALHADHLIGNVAPGMEADLAIIDLASTPAITQASSRAQDIWARLFPTIMMGDDRAIRAVWVAGEPVLGGAP